MTVTLYITQRERLAACAFRAGETLAEIAAILGVTTEEAAAWLDSPRIDEACQGVTRSDTHRNTTKTKQRKTKKVER